MTKPYAEVIGDPISHSKSPLIHNFWAEALGLDVEYRAVHVTPEGLAAYFAERKADPDWRGCNITVPHKVEALAHVEDRGDVRTTIGAINTVIRAEDGALVGTNTDAAGFYAPLSELDLAGQPVTVIGAGGAAPAILFALSRMGVGRQRHGGHQQQAVAARPAALLLCFVRPGVGLAPHRVHIEFRAAPFFLTRSCVTRDGVAIPLISRGPQGQSTEERRAGRAAGRRDRGPPMAQSSRDTFSLRSCRSCASTVMVAIGRAARRPRLIGSPVTSQ